MFKEMLSDMLHYLLDIAQTQGQSGQGRMSLSSGLAGNQADKNYSMFEQRNELCCAVTGVV